MPFDSYKPVFARNFVLSSSQKLETTAAPLTVLPMTMAVWFTSTNVTTSQNILVVRNGAFEWRLNLGGNAAGDPVRTVVSSTVGGTTSTGYLANRWHHACGVFTSDTDRAVYLDGGGKGTSSTSLPIFSTPNVATIGAGNGNPHDGMLAWPAIWKATLTDLEVARLAGGECPLNVRRESLVAFWDFNGGDTEFGMQGLFPAVNTGSTPVNGPGFLRTKIPRPWMLGSGYVAAAGGLAHGVIGDGIRGTVIGTNGIVIRGAA